MRCILAHYGIKLLGAHLFKKIIPLHGPRIEESKPGRGYLSVQGCHILLYLGILSCSVALIYSCVIALVTLFLDVIKQSLGIFQALAIVCLHSYKHGLLNEAEECWQDQLECKAIKYTPVLVLF